jgi:hypothetical protein
MVVCPRRRLPQQPPRPAAAVENAAGFLSGGAKIDQLTLDPQFSALSVSVFSHSLSLSRRLARLRGLSTLSFASIFVYTKNGRRWVFRNSFNTWNTLEILISLVTVHNYHYLFQKCYIYCSYVNFL